MGNSKRLDITIGGKDTSKNAMKSASSNIKNLSRDVKTAGRGISMKSGFDKIKRESQTAATGVKTQMSSMVNNVKSQGSKLSMKSGFNKIKTEAKTAATYIVKSFQGIGGAITSLLAGVSLGTIIQQAGSAESKWNRIAAFTGTTKENIKGLQTVVKGVANEYGLVNGEVSSAFETNVRFYDSTKKALFITKGAAATAKMTGKTIEEVNDAIQSGELGRSRAMAKQLLTAEQYNKYLDDGKLTQEEIDQILKENIAYVSTNADLTSDSASSWNRMQTSIDSIMVTIGTSLLPII